MIVRTKNSTYRVIPESKTWERLQLSPESGTLRTESGNFNDIALLEIGKPMVLVCPPIEERATHRMVTTSTVLEIKEEQ